MTLTALARPALAAALVLLATACGAPPPGAVLTDGALEHRPPGGAWSAVEPGRIPFGNGDTLRAVGGDAEIVIACLPPLTGTPTAADAQGPGLALVTLTDGSALRRRRDSMLDLLEGRAVLDAGPLRTRLVVFHGEVFLEVHEGHADNAKGVAIAARIEGEEMIVTVARGAVQLLSPVATPKDLHEVKLAVGETGHAAKGVLPRKAGAAPDSE